MIVMKILEPVIILTLMCICTEAALTIAVIHLVVDLIANLIKAASEPEENSVQIIEEVCEKTEEKHSKQVQCPFCKIHRNSQQKTEAEKALEHLLPIMDQANVVLMPEGADVDDMLTGKQQTEKGD